MVTSLKSVAERVLALCSPQRVVAGLVFIPLLAYSFAPFRDMALSFPQRLVFWTGVMALALAVTWAAGRLVQMRLHQRGVIIRDAVFAIVILTLFAPALWVFAWLVFSFGGQDAPSLSTVLPYGALFATGLLLIRHREFEAVESPQPYPRLYQRLPEGFSGQVYRLTVRNHHVDVVTSQGTFTIRSRFTDAIAEMEPEPGHCAHRSHWVTRAAIAGVERQKGKTFLLLCNGDEVPVSRKYHPALEEAGVV